ncbi:MAG: hypothetical protein K2W96_10285 [Gemmataceae bacterium]|nr:hypothetical protein [Gemmataceae bacterium]
MTEAEWLACEEPFALIGHLWNQVPPTARQARLFACSCHRSVWDGLAESEPKGLMLRRSVEIAEGLAEGRIPHRERRRFLEKEYKGRAYGYGSGHDEYSMMGGLLHQDPRQVMESAASYSHRTRMAHGAGMQVGASPDDGLGSAAAPPFRLAALAKPGSPGQATTCTGLVRHPG